MVNRARILANCPSALNSRSANVMRDTNEPAYSTAHGDAKGILLLPLDRSRFYDDANLANGVNPYRRINVNRILNVCVAALLYLLSVGIGFGFDDEVDTSGDDSDLLTIGSLAPDLDIEHWVQDGDGKFSHVTKFEKGQVYVVEFWATWCQPCISSMPHISELQQDYADKDVQIISISDEDLETVEKFLERDVPGDDDITYQELTKAYCLTTDPDRSSHKSYLQAAGQGGIPTAFIVGKDGKIEWIGHPIAMTKPLKKIVEGKWNRDEFAAQFKPKQMFEVGVNKIMRKLNGGEIAEGVELIDQMLAKIDDEEKKLNLKMLRFQALLQSDDDPEKAASSLRDLNEALKDKPEALNEFAWAIVMLSEDQNVNKDLLQAAREGAEMAVEADPENGAILDTLAHLLALQGELDKAIEIQTKAVEFTEDQFKEEIENYLKELKKQKSKSDESDDDR
jgi:thiol-disulfide isomerase/thioredoxin